MRKDWIEIELRMLHKKRTASVNPKKHLDETFELFSIPAYDNGKPELLKGRDIGSSKKIVVENDVLLSRIVPHIQRSWIVPTAKSYRQICSTEWIIFDGSNLFPKYLRWYFLSHGFHMKFMSTISGVGGSLTRANPNETAKFKIPLAPLPEQRAIVDKIEQLFSKLDNGIANLKAAKEKLEIYRQAVLKKAFEDGFGIINYSSDWQILKIKDLCEVVRGGSPRPAGDKRFYGGDIPFLKVADLTRNSGAFLSRHTFTIKEAGLNKTRFVEANTLLLTNSGATLGVPKICTFPTTFNDGIAAFLGLDKKTLLYHYYFWCSKTLELRGINQGAAQPNLNTNMIGNIDLPVGPIKDMQKIVDEIETRLSVCDNVLANINEALEKTEALRQSILKKGFEGKLLSEEELETCRKEPDWEPAEKLLARIEQSQNKETKDKKAAKA